MDVDGILARLRQLLADAPAEVQVDLDDTGSGAVAFVRRDMLHLDADALNDRLAAWTARDLADRLPHASAFVSFRHASPATPDDAELDLQEKWLGLEPSMRLELEQPPPSEADLRAFAAEIPRFLRVLQADGRPEGWRRVDEGHAE